MDVKKVCILGAGTMGNQLTQLAALSGYQVTMVDIEDKFVQNGLIAIKSNLKKFFVDKAKMTQEEADKVFARISGTTDIKKAVEGVQVVIECIPEEMDLKQKMFKRLDEACAPETILASNTSSLSITSIGSLTGRPDKIIGMHFFNPVAVMRLVEIIRSAKTSDETYEAIKAMSVKLGKEVVTVKKDVAGFIVSMLSSATVLIPAPTRLPFALAAATTGPSRVSQWAPAIFGTYTMPVKIINAVTKVMN